jgi:hypothetical protein
MQLFIFQGSLRFANQGTCTVGVVAEDFQRAAGFISRRLGAIAEKNIGKAPIDHYIFFQTEEDAFAYSKENRVPFNFMLYVLNAVVECSDKESPRIVFTTDPYIAQSDRFMTYELGENV